MREFQCPVCQKSSDLEYITQDDMLYCTKCKIRIGRADAISGEPLWITRTGSVIPIKKLETSHLQNCIGLIFVRGGSWRGHMLGLLVEELERRDPTYKHD